MEASTTLINSVAAGDKTVSIHTLHELEARVLILSYSMAAILVSIHTLHELEARLALQN
ncbi:hypothetical protein MICAF_1910013 [Microcystis aeruginosa PCC 9807]|uniref:Uncharacterized protein n=1 Tax=Microcystis aeruginosa PCC 9807 TaxID=1160283 RepID=I4H2R4_MICAE|nr:hypothetical protein MICAF_1910013 [Microcystis aeruginosa PCC 9807]